MKVALILALFFIAAECNLDPSEFSPELTTFTRQLHEKCQARTNVKDEYIVAHKKGNFAVNDISLKKYISCLWIESKAINEDFVADAALFYRLMPTKVSSYLVPIYLDCIRLVKLTAPASCALENRTFTLNQCIYYRDSNDWIFF